VLTRERVTKSAPHRARWRCALCATGWVPATTNDAAMRAMSTHVSVAHPLMPALDSRSAA
jgi:hypothetical protein